VVGAGLAGLAAAWRLARAGSQVSVLELADGAGGRLAGARVEGYPLEPMPALVGAWDSRLLGWIGELGLRDALLPAKPVVTAFAGREGLSDIELRSLGDVARIPGVRRHHAWRLVRLPRLLARYGPDLALGAGAERLDDRSLADFARLYFGESALAHWMAPYVCGSLGDPQQMSRVQFLQHYRAQGLARAGVLQGAWSELIDRASAAATVANRCRVERIEAEPAGGFRVRAADGRVFTGDAVVLAVPAPVAAQIADSLITTPERSFLGAVRYAPALAVSAVLCRPLVPRARWVAMAESASPLGSLLVEPGYRGGRVPAGGGLALLRATGAFAAAHPETPSETLEKELLAEVDRLWPGFANGVEFTRVFRHRFGAPRFDVGAYRSLARFRRVQADRRAAGRRLAFAGDYLVHPSLEGAVRAGEGAAADLLGD
jgi:oxygen-dependent protoporphyrinogen oxidase